MQILSLPRSGSSAVSKILTDIGYASYKSDFNIQQSSSEFNKDGYFEDSLANLCFDNLIRFSHGLDKSFLYNHGMETSKVLMNVRLEASNQSYDLDETTIDLPVDYSKNVESYTGQTWDTWGLSRMAEGGKWNKAYSKAGVEIPRKSKEKFDEILLTVKNGENKVFIKDPRLIYLQPLQNTVLKTILIERNISEVRESMRNHYGPNLFKKPFSERNWVSNHFNYKIQYQDFDEYIEIYNNFKNLVTGKQNWYKIDINTISEYREQKKLLTFLKD